MTEPQRTSLAVTDDQISALEGFSGALLLPGDRGYEHARGVFNALIDRRPALIAQCSGVADVVAAVGFARANGLEVSVRGGGHSVAGTAVTDGGVMVDLSRMRGVHVDEAARTIRAQGGARWREIDRETQLHALAVPGGTVSSTGVGGLTLGGGLGWLSGKHGLTADNLLSAEVVTADGRTLAATAEENDDLFWALRGGGGNFGVVTSFEFRLHSVGPTVTGGVVSQSYARARDVLRLCREVNGDAPDELSVDTALHFAPDGSGEKLIGIGVCHVGTRKQADRDLGSLRALGPAFEAGLGSMLYTAVNTMLDGAYPSGRFTYWRSGFLTELSNDAIDVLVEQFERCPPSLSALVLRRFHGEVTRVPVAATAFPHRQPGYYLAATSAWVDPAATDANIAWTQETFAALAPFLAERRWTSFLGEDDGGGNAARAAYGPNLERLAQVKAAYDPSNVFHLNVNIRPASRRTEGG